ncbi:hypothetical protein CY34DRAFT_328663 [Suillus luteus UH-Slu-Lm8-n1]|uniref:CHAT domain-containing protein n=1 Tax=Suillus luteus UH-Slu-Lm8-n1 TaxID=930992 RepID=A0A0D0AYW5_9AGAM|nr:hypothetical protein CY34DRAFT_328663 [Suillus luteus UH-Slu-Lm8-n1]
MHSAESVDASNLGQERPAASMIPLSPNQLAYLAKWFLRRDDPHGLDEVISLHYHALGYYNAMHPCRGQLLCNLGVMLDTRFERQGNDEDLDHSIIFQREGLALCPVGHPVRSMSLNNLANQLSTRFDQRGNDKDLDEAITLHKEALALRPVGHTDRFMSLSNLVNCLGTRFDHRGNAEDLDQAIALQREALALCPVGHSHRSSSLNHLAIQLSTRFDHRGDAEDLDQAIALQREALALRPVGHTDRPVSLYNLAERLSNRFIHRGKDEDLDEAIALQKESLALCPVGHRYRPPLLNGLAAQLFIFFDHRGNHKFLEGAIALNREALTLCPVGHTDRPESLSGLANRLSARFRQRGNDGDLDEAIELHREALALRPVGRTYRSKSLDYLAVQLSTRFARRGNTEDLNQAIALQTEALTLRPVGHTKRSSSLNNLAAQLSTRFDHRGDVEDLDQAIALHREVQALCPVGHTDRSKSLNNLANQLSTRFDQRGNDEDLDEAIVLCREALALRSVGHTDRPMSLNDLGKHLFTPFDHRGNREDLDESLEILQYALTLLTRHDPRQVILHNSFATVYLSLYRLRLDGTGAGEDHDSLNAAMHHLKTAANVVSAGLPPRLRESLSWVRHARQHSHDTELEAHATSMQLLDAYISTTTLVSSRHNIMKNFPSTLAMDAASCALHSGDVRHAVELLEQGRTIIWTQMTRLRTPLDSLQAHGDHAAVLMKKFRDISSLLDKPPVNYPEAAHRVDVEAQETRYRRLVEDWNGVVEEIRKIEGFSRFLLPPLFSDLQEAARDGPIIVLVASKSSCDAITILHQQPPTSIQLPTNLTQLQELVIALREAIKKDAGPKGNQTALIKVLRMLWDDVVRLVVQNLGRFAPRGSRIWWCPTSLFNFLPLHAAGEYRANGESLSQRYISSYTPSLTALMRARRSHARSLSVPFAAIGQNCPAGHSSESTLEFVEPELELVRSLLPNLLTVSFTKITSVDATKSRALCAMQDHTWLHFACHGTQNHWEPFMSAFLMRDQPLSLLDITQTDLSRHEVAFLSACDTAVGDSSTPDEVIHLATGLQFAGVKSVVGTLWKVTDATVQRLVEEFYKHFCKDGNMNSKRAAQALHQAVHSLARDKDMPLDQRIVFVHIGV